MTRSETGKLGEEKVCEYLTQLGYTIAARNFRIKGGEIDIIAEDGTYLAFVEVKVMLMPIFKIVKHNHIVVLLDELLYTY